MTHALYERSTNFEFSQKSVKHNELYIKANREIIALKIGRDNKSTSFKKHFLELRAYSFAFELEQPRCQPRRRLD
jgi:hypothetical protein